MAALWSDIVAGSPSRAAVAFFPKDAYVRLKAIAGAGADWAGRLFGNYALDVGAAHALLGSRAARAAGPLGRTGRLLQRDRLLRGPKRARRV
jgi:hypothetical protein